MWPSPLVAIIYGPTALLVQVLVGNEARLSALARRRSSYSRILKKGPDDIDSARPTTRSTPSHLFLRILHDLSFFLTGSSTSTLFRLYILSVYACIATDVVRSRLTPSISPDCSLLAHRLSKRSFSSSWICAVGKRWCGGRWCSCQCDPWPCICIAVLGF